MARDLDRVLTTVMDVIAEGGSVLLMTDYDGTLTPIVSDPAEACLPVAVREHLRMLARAPRARVAVISGRDLADVLTRVGVPEAFYAGCHGLEIRGPELSFTHPDAEAQQETLRAVSLALCLGAPFVEGMRVEPKRLGVAIHYRHVTLTAHRQMETELARSLQQQGGQFKIFHGSKVIEVLPQVSWNKGTCALWLRNRVTGALPPPVLELYMGDDWTDEYVFEALAGKAVTVCVGQALPATRAQYRFATVEEAQQLVAALAAAVGDQEALPRPGARRRETR